MSLLWIEAERWSRMEVASMESAVNNSVRTSVGLFRCKIVDICKLSCKMA